MFRIAVCDDSPETIRQMKEDILKMPQISMQGRYILIRQGLFIKQKKL